LLASLSFHHGSDANGPEIEDEETEAWITAQRRQFGTMPAPRARPQTKRRGHAIETEIMKVAIVHYWLVGMRGGEKVVEALCDMFPTADIFTHVYSPEAVSERIRARTVKTTFIAGLPRAARWYKSYLPLMPLALEQLDLRGYDLIISSESGPAKGIIPDAAALHLCYCHSPMRYIWNMYHEYRQGAGFMTRIAMPPVAHYLRTWDVASTVRVDHFVANSQTVAARVRRYYGRTAAVVSPPVDVDAFSLAPESERGDYMLMVGELVPYKRPDLAVEAFNRMRAKLVIIGGGEMLDRIRRLAGPTVTVMGPRPFEDLRYHYARCRALIFPGEEDFGIVPVEAMASGRPVIAYGRGGATETVISNLSGLLFEEQSVDCLIAAVRTFEKMEFDPTQIAAHARNFSVERFVSAMTDQINHLLSAGVGEPARS
jgi:glycosyltransferase involved in cell wall biosynthesis